MRKYWSLKNKSKNNKAFQRKSSGYNVYTLALCMEAKHEPVQVNYRINGRPYKVPDDEKDDWGENSEGQPCTFGEIADCEN